MLTSKLLKQTVDNLFRFNPILINHKITYEKTPFPPAALVWKSGIQYHRSPASLVAAISIHSLATLPSQMSAFKSHMRQNVQYRN